jgi:biotin transporter BioY
MAILILLTAFLFGGAIISFFTSSIDFTKGKYLLLGGMVLSLLLLVYLSGRNWFKRMESIKAALDAFEDPAEG